jgi:outer membrane receptor for ferrienterochelin and colicin
MFRIYLCLFLIYIISFYSYAQPVQINGFVKDLKSAEGLINAHVIEVNSGKGVITNSYGFFSLKMAGSEVLLNISYVGYQTKNLPLFVNKDTTLIIEMESRNEVDEVKVTAKTGTIHSLRRTTGNLFLTGKELESIPGLFGEKDILKSLQLMPGIQQGREGTSGIFVRGGDRGQNLILLDGVPVYNVNHLWGIFSVFTPEAVKSVDVYKGGFPARYGGRLSSVLDIRLKEGNMNDTKYDFTIGTAAMKALVEGPLKKGKSSFIVSARRTYADLFYTPLKRLFVYKDGETTTKNWSGYYFLDLNAKTNFILSESDWLYISAYIGSDHLYMREKMEKTEKISSGADEFQENIEYTSDFKNSWGNFTSSVRWNKIISPKFFSNTTLTYSSYDYQFGNEYNVKESSVFDTVRFDENFRNVSGITNYGVAIDFDYYVSTDYSMKFGIKTLFNSYLPGKYENSYRAVGGEKKHIVLSGEKIRTNEYSLYIENHLNFTTWLSANIGINALFYSGEEFFDFSFQPRLLANFLLSRRLTLKTGYSKMAQPLHLLVNNGASYPVDIWVPAVKEVKPSISHQFEMGIYYTTDKLLEMSTELYWKKMNGVLNYRNGESFFYLNETWESKVTSGKGFTYGLETLLKKSKGKSTGWVGYNLSWAFRQFEDLNRGKAFPFRYDTRHRFNTVLMHQLNKNIDISLTWVLASGAPVTLSETAYDGETLYENVTYGGTLEQYLRLFNPPRAPGKTIYYSALNNYRLPAYHRLDAGINFRKKKKYGQRIWNISVYNLYNRNNPFFLTYKIHDEAFHTPERGTGEYKNFSFFGILPSVSYRIIIE